MKKFLVGILVFLTVSFSVNKNNKLYIFLRSLIELILEAGIKIVYFFRTTLDSVGNVRTRVAKKRFEREYVMTSIGELKENVAKLNTQIESLSSDLTTLGNLYNDFVFLANKKGCDDCKCSPQPAPPAMSVADENKYYALIDSLKTSTDTLQKQIEEISLDVRKV